MFKYKNEWDKGKSENIPSNLDNQAEFNFFCFSLFSLFVFVVSSFFLYVFQIIGEPTLYGYIGQFFLILYYLTFFSLSCI